MSSASTSPTTAEVSSWPLENHFRWFVSLMVWQEAGRWARHEVEFHQLSARLEWNLMRDVHEALHGAWPEVAQVHIDLDGTDVFGIYAREVRFRKGPGDLQVCGTVSTQALLRHDVARRVDLVLAFAVHCLVLVLERRKLDGRAMVALRDRLVDVAGCEQWRELEIPRVFATARKPAQDGSQ